MGKLECRISNSARRQAVEPVHGLHTKGFESLDVAKKSMDELYKCKKIINDREKLLKEAKMPNSKGSKMSSRSRSNKILELNDMISGFDEVCEVILAGLLEEQK